MKGDFYFRRHPVLANVIIIILIAIIGILIVFFSLNLFTRHGASAMVPEVENMTYTQAIKSLHEHGFRTDIRDSIYNEEIPPGYVVEQFPKAGSYVKPGRKIFLYINAVHPREVLIDSDNSSPGNALKGYSMRQGLAKLEELGFKNVKVVKVPGDSDRVIRLIVNGRTIGKMEKVPINALITMEVYNGQLREINDSILMEEYLEYVNEMEEEETEVGGTYTYTPAPVEQPEVVEPENTEEPEEDE